MQVFGIDEVYFLAAEWYQCQPCGRKVISWNPEVMAQLDVAKRDTFPCVLTYRLAADMSVVRMLRSRGLGNSPNQLYNILREQHGEAWLAKVMQYMSSILDYTRGKEGVRQYLLHEEPQQPPPQIPLPTSAWLLSVHMKDVFNRYEDIAASITSTFGSILKMDSTKKVNITLMEEQTLFSCLTV